MKYIKSFESFSKLIEDENTDTLQLSKPVIQILLDGTSSSGKSAALNNLSQEWCVIAVDSFYNVMFEELGKADFGNSEKPKISEIYPNCPYSISEPDSNDWENAARWFMAQEAIYGKINQAGIVDATGKSFGRSSSQTNVVYDDVQGNIIKEVTSAGLVKPKWILVHAPIDHLILNLDRRKDTDGRDPQGVFVGAYCFKYEAKPIEGGVDPTKSWTADEIKQTLNNPDWADNFINKLGVKQEDSYWIYAKDPQYGTYDVVVNTRNEHGGQMTIDEVANAVTREFN